MGETKKVEQAVEYQAAQLGGVGDAVLASLLARPVAGNVHLAQQSRLARQPWFVAVKRDDVGGPVALEKPAVERTYPSVGDKDEVDNGRVGLEVARDLPTEAPDIGAQAALATG